jgi:diphthamide biosynthesis enzyme Dph1/Dph2-like protein
MIANPSLKAYRYDPYSKEFTQEFYAHDLMKQNRKQAIETAKVSAVNTVTDIAFTEVAVKIVKF